MKYSQGKIQESQRSREKKNIQQTALVATVQGDEAIVQLKKKLHITEDKSSNADGFSKEHVN